MTVREDVGDVVLRYARGVDRRDWELVRACFADEAMVEGSRFSGPIDEYLAILRPGVEAFPTTMHFMGNQLAEIDGDRASTETYAIAHHFADAEGRDERIVMGVRYLDDLERRDGRWVIVHRRAISDWIRESEAQ
jgi:hypothetical protein